LFGFALIVWEFPDDQRFEQIKNEYGNKHLLVMNIATDCQVCESSANEASALAPVIATMKKELGLRSVSSVPLDSF